MTVMLEQNGLRLLKLIDDLLDLVRFDTGHADVNRQITPIAAHIEGLLRSLRHLAEQDRVALLWDCKSDSEAILLDRDKFDKILLNLVINAIKFTPHNGTITMRFAVVTAAAGGPAEELFDQPILKLQDDTVDKQTSGYLRIEIADSGAGGCWCWCWCYLI